MFANYIKIAIRTFMRFKGYALINLTGLAIGLATGIFILMYVLDEVSYDRFHEKADRIYRVGTDMTDIKTGAVNGSIAGNGWPIGALLKKDYPEVEAVTYLRNGGLLFINHEGKRFEERIVYASNDFFKLFTFPLKEGNPSTALSQPNSIVITESMEKKYFNGEALGRTMTFVDTLSLIVTGVMKDVPSQSHMQFDVLVSFDTYLTINKSFSFNDGWGNLNVWNYVLLKQGTNAENFIAKARNVYMNYVKDKLEKYGMYMYVHLEPFKEVYLKTKMGNGMGPLGSLERVYLVSGVGIFVILLACINFINLATARSVYRSKEVGLRKVVGSSRSALINQFMSESFLLTLISFLLALALVGLLLPLFNQLVNKSYHLNALLDLKLGVALGALIVVVSFFSGYYPAVVISGLRPTEMLKGKMFTSSKGVQLRRALIVFQFMISAGLIVCTMVVSDQIHFMKSRNLGFAGDQIVALDVTKVPSDATVPDSLRGLVLKNEIKQLASVLNITYTNALPGRPGWVGQWAHATDKSAEETIGVEYMTIDEDYLSTLGITLIAGRNFDLSRIAEIKDGLIINEKAVQQFGWETPEKAIGKKIDSPSKAPAGTVIGVVKDYHEFGLQREIYPMTMAYQPRFSRYYAIKFNAAKTDQLLSSLEALWKKHYEGYDFRYFFLSENFEKQYQAENILAKVFTVFAVMTVLIAIIGLVGLVSFMVVSRTKEIGVRKVLGANVMSITKLLSKEFLVLVVVANVIAFPMAWFLSNQWLEKFAYRTIVQPEIFVYTLLAGFLITLVAVSSQTIKAAMSNPVQSLRSE